MSKLEQLRESYLNFSSLGYVDYYYTLLEEDFKNLLWGDVENKVLDYGKVTEYALISTSDDGNAYQLEVNFHGKVDSNYVYHIELGDFKIDGMSNNVRLKVGNEEEYEQFLGEVFDFQERLIRLTLEGK